MGNNELMYAIYLLLVTESTKAKEGDGFDQVGSNPCNSKFSSFNLQFVLSPDGSISDEIFASGYVAL